MVEQHELLTESVRIRCDVAPVHRQAWIAGPLADVAQHLIVGTVFPDDVDDVLHQARLTGALGSDVWSRGWAWDDVDNRAQRWHMPRVTVSPARTSVLLQSRQHQLRPSTLPLSRSHRLMPAASLLTLIDDISAMLDDVATMTKVAAGKTSAVMGDDLALNAEQVAGVRVERELPVVWEVAKRSFINKLILVPAALVISAFLPAAIVPLMMIGGLFLCYEGFEKIAHKFLHSRDLVATPTTDAKTAPSPIAILTPADLTALERTKVKGAVRTDFVLSAEIIVITLGTLTAASFGQQVLVLSLIAIGATVLVYGLVAGIVKLDDLGLALRARGAGVQRALGSGILRATPVMMKGLSILGTVAMFTVGGSILVHGTPIVEHQVEAITAAVGTPGSVLATVTRTVLDAVSGVLAGGVAVAVMTVAKRVGGKRAV